MATKAAIERAIQLAHNLSSLLAIDKMTDEDIVSGRILANNIIAELKPKDVANDAIAAIIYAAYPRKVAVAAAKSAILSAINRGVDPHFLLERVQLYAKCKDGSDKQYIPHASTWFNQERYNDDESEWQHDTRHPSKGHIVKPITEELWGIRSASDSITSSSF